MRNALFLDNNTLCVENDAYPANSHRVSDLFTCFHCHVKIVAIKAQKMTIFVVSSKTINGNFKCLDTLNGISCCIEG